MISANGGLLAHRYTPQVTPRWPRGSEPASQVDSMIHQAVSPCLEFSAEDSSFVSNNNTARVVNSAAGYYEEHYWAP